jgi:Holliday junction DNA helicase RuvB
MRFVGQDTIRDYLAIEIKHAKAGHPMEHILFTGPAGMGKSTLARLIAQELGAELHTYVADSSWVARKVYLELLKFDITGYTKGGGMLPNARKHVIFMDECHLLPVYEPWYSALQEGVVFVDGYENWLPEITFIGATNVPVFPKAFLDRIPLKFRFSPYTVEDLQQIVQDSFPHIPNGDARDIAVRSRGTARITLHYGDAYMKHGGLSFFARLGIDERGLCDLDRAYLAALRSYNRPLSLNSLAGIIGEDKKSLEANVEPFLKSLGLLLITPQGRVLAEGGVIARRGPKQVDVLERSIA